MNFDEAADRAADTIHSIFGNKEKRGIEVQLATAADAWSAYEKGMDWDPNYLLSMGTLDMDTEEFAAVTDAAADLAATLSSSSAGGMMESYEKARAFLSALEAYRSEGWDAPDGAHEQLASLVSEVLDVTFTGRHGGGSTNNPC